ncbi:MAG TPA: tRNA (adenosine(37)-N6)-threonylcarbamoyltransferase complex dimerization subunit type 1 TsaB [Gaiellaceae bacterium]
MTTILAFDTAASVATCALVAGGELLGERRTQPRALLADADALLRDAGLEPAELDALVVGTGPGSFTSIRMGLASARGLGLALGIPAAGVSSLLAYAGGEPVLDAKRGEVFVAGPSVVRPEDLEVEGKRLVGDGAVRYRDVFEAAGAVVPPDDDPDHVPRAHLLVAAAGPPSAVEAIEPTYVRVPDAVARA